MEDAYRLCPCCRRFSHRLGKYLAFFLPSQYGLVIAAVFECIVIGWIYKTSRLREHINHYSMRRLNKWWWDASVKIVTPIVLVILLVSSLIEEFSSPYGGYPWMAIIVIGRDWLIYTLFFAVIVSSHSWKTDPRHRMISLE